MWRTDKAHKLRKEKEEDEKIMRSKEKAMKLQEPSVSFVKKDDEDGTKDGEKKPNGVTIDVIPTVIIEIPSEDKPSSRRGSLRFRDIVESGWEPLEEKDETVENEEEESQEQNGERETDTESDTSQELDDQKEQVLEESETYQEQNLNSHRPHRDPNKGPPTLTTQLPYKIDEDGGGSNEMLTSTA